MVVALLRNCINKVMVFGVWVWEGDEVVLVFNFMHK